MSQGTSNLPLDAPHYTLLRHLLLELVGADPEHKCMATHYHHGIRLFPV